MAPSDELRALEESSEGRITVRHTLTDFEVEGKEEEVSSDYWLPGRHYHFTSQWNPFKPESGDLLTEDGEEAGLRGRIDQAMLAEQLPAPAEGVRVAVCGPPEMWEDMRSALLELGHAEENLVELKALTDDQVRCAWLPRALCSPSVEAVCAAQMREQGLLPPQEEEDDTVVVPGPGAAAEEGTGMLDRTIGLIKEIIGRPWQAKL